jgi:hypothetical protein
MKALTTMKINDIPLIKGSLKYKNIRDNHE